MNRTENTGVTIDAHFQQITIDVDQWLDGRVTVHDELDAIFQAFMSARPDTSYLHDMIEFANVMRGKSADEDNHGTENFTVHNTYNGESFLSDVLQWVYFSHDEYGDVVLISRHLGGDVRGNYGRPTAYQLDGMEGTYDLYDETVSLVCERAESGIRDGQEEFDLPDLPDLPAVLEHTLTIRPDGEVIDYGGNFHGTGDLWGFYTSSRGWNENRMWFDPSDPLQGGNEDSEDEEFLQCPYCLKAGEHVPMRAYLQ